MSVETGTQSTLITTEPAVIMHLMYGLQGAHRI